MECSINYRVHHDLQINVTKEKKDSKSKEDIEEEKMWVNSFYKSIYPSLGIDEHENEIE